MTIVLMLVNFIVNCIMLIILLPLPTAILLFFCGPRGKALANLILDSGFTFYSALILIPALLSIIPAFQRIRIIFSPYRSAQGEELKKIQSALAPVLQRSGLDPRRFHLYVNPDKSLNAFAIGNNNIIVNESLLKSFPQEELTGILAHEMGHLQKGHTKSSLVIWGMSMSNQLFFMCYSIFIRIAVLLIKLMYHMPIDEFIVSMLELFIAFLYGFLKAANFLLNYPLLLFNLFCSRQDEYEADHYACELGLGWQLYKGLSHLDRYCRQSQLGFWDRILSTHPDMSERLKRINIGGMENKHCGPKLTERNDVEARGSGTATLNKNVSVAALVAACLVLFMVSWNRRTPGQLVNFIYPSKLTQLSPEASKKLAAQKQKALKQEAEKAAQQKGDQNTLVVLYHKDQENGPMWVSQTDITFHMGQRIHIKPDATNRGTGFLRLMGSAQEPDIIRSRKAGKPGTKGSATEFIITAKGLGVTHCKLVPNYGDWEHAAPMTFRVVE